MATTIERLTEKIETVLIGHTGDLELAGAVGESIARLVLRELREPSEAMLFGFGVHKARVKGNWRVMIDRALLEGRDD